MAQMDKWFGRMCGMSWIRSAYAYDTSPCGHGVSVGCKMGAVEVVERVCVCVCG